MCYNFEPTIKNAFVGYKVVAKKNGKYYSILTGNLYPKTGKPIPVWSSQRKGLGIFYQLLPGNKKQHEIWEKKRSRENGLWKKEMVGKTSIFDSQKDAVSRMNAWRLIPIQAKASGFILVVVKARLSGKLLRAKYGILGQYVTYVGTHMEILKEVKCSSQ